MKTKMVILLISITTIGCTQDRDFKSERISKTASFNALGEIREVFPLFGAFEERKWAEGWEPKLIYPEQETMEEGTTFSVSGHGHESLWIVTKYEPQNYQVQYLVSTENRFWTIDVVCQPVSKEEQTKVTVTYAYTGLNAKGNEQNRAALHHMFHDDLQDWSAAINAYLGS